MIENPIPVLLRIYKYPKHFIINVKYVSMQLCVQSSMVLNFVHLKKLKQISLFIKYFEYLNSLIACYGICVEHSVKEKRRLPMGASRLE